LAKGDITRVGVFGTHVLWEGEVVEPVMVPFEIAMVVSYRLSIVTNVLSLTVRRQFAVECLRRSYQQVTLGQQFVEERVD